MSEQKLEKVKPWQWPAEWVKDEKFWRDVATRTASGLFRCSYRLLVRRVYGICTESRALGKRRSFL